MFKKSAALFYYALTPVHVGAGSSVSYVDLPVQRERHTSFPIMAGSSIKGVFRSLANRTLNNNKTIDIIFGPEDGSEASSCVAFTDAKILLYPVRSVKYVFAWITCPYVLNRFREDLKSGDADINISIPELKDDSKIIISTDSQLKIDNSKVGLEEFVFEIQNNSDIKKLIEAIKNLLPDVNARETLSQRFAIVTDNVFTDLVNYAVEVRTRIKIDQVTGTVQSGALFTVEMVPSESIFYSLVFASDPFKKSDNNSEIKDVNNVLKVIEDLSNNSVLQIGGDETIGIGFMKCKYFKLGES